ncbi:MAG: hypothetical protein AAF532_14685 [Planctomycetota bacterium]
MPRVRFEVGTAVMCNLGASGWKLGRIIALDYREDDWPAGKTAPYQVSLDDDHALIYVPEDDTRYCREATPEDLRIAGRTDALAPLPRGPEPTSPRPDTVGTHAAAGTPLGCIASPTPPGSPGYRDGRCHGCDCCPRNWSAVELYSEHYRCAERVGLKVTRHAVDLGTVRVGDSIHHRPAEGLPGDGGFMQCPTLVRLPPGVRFSDDGSLTGEVRFDPHRDAAYGVEFVAVSTARWDDPAIGIVRSEITFRVEGNEPPDRFDRDAFKREQDRARVAADRSLRNLGDAWGQWERGELGNRDTCARMGAELRELRDLLERHPRLDGGRWWTHLGGYHMNVHKLLENALFECELYLGHALTFGDAEVRWIAEQNLDGCYQKRLLEAARFLWIDGLEQMLRGEWAAAAETLRRAAAKKDGWGWAVNFGDIWFTESAARLVHGAETAAVANSPAEHRDAEESIAEATRLLERGVARTAESEYFGPEGHPWAAEIRVALDSYRSLRADHADASAWLDAFRSRTIFWCGQVLGGVEPFPPRPRPRREDAAALAQRLPGHNA